MHIECIRHLYTWTHTIPELIVPQLGLVSSIPETATDKIEGMKAKLSQLWASLQDNKEELMHKERQLKGLLQPYVSLVFGGSSPTSATMCMCRQCPSLGRKHLTSDAEIVAL